MIRTSLTLNINPQDGRFCSYLANATHLGLLSQSAQTIHVQTSHRPVQLVVAIRAQDTSGASLTIQRQQINAWQEFGQLLARRGTSELNSLMHQYHLQPDWLICLDEFHLQAWLPPDAGFYLLRQDSLRRLRPVTFRDLAHPDEEESSDRQYYTLTLAPADQFYLMPPELLTYYSTGEAASILLGLRQMPARMGDLFNTARQRGFSGEFTWLALQIIHLEPDEVPGVKHQFDDKPKISLAALIGLGSQQSNEVSTTADSLSAADPLDENAREASMKAAQQYIRQRRIWLALTAIIAIVVIAAAVLLLSHLFAQSPVETTSSQTSGTTEPVAATPTPTLSPTPRPTPSPTPTAPVTKLTVIARQLNLRESPDRNSKLLATLNSGDVVTQLAAPEGDWVKVKTESGLIGYVYFNYVAAVTPTP